MKTEISRDSHQPEKRYSGVYQQQGRMLTDADWNELVEILKNRLNDALKDVVGCKEGGIGGVPRHRALKIINDATDTFKIQPGHIYVDGVAAQVPGDADIAYGAQPDFPSPPDLPENYVLYADVWESTVTQLMDERLRDKGLHGADTCTRKQTMVQIKWCPDNVDPEQPEKNPSKGNAKLTATLLKNTTQPDPCDPCADTVDVDSKVGNYLFRVEVHDVIEDANGPPEITLKWSSENGAKQFEAKATKEEMPAGFVDDIFVYEFFNETSEKHLGVHLASNTAFPDREVLHEVYPASLPDGFNFVRRWDGYATFQWDTLNAEWRLHDGISGGVDLTEDSSSTKADKVLKLDSVELKLQLLNLVVSGPVTSDSLAGTSPVDLVINEIEIGSANSSANEKAAAVNSANASVTATANTVLEGIALSEKGKIDAGHLKINTKDIGQILAADNVKAQADAVVNAINAKFSSDADFAASMTPEGAMVLMATDGRNIEVEVTDIETSRRCGFEKGTNTRYGCITLTSSSNSDITITGEHPEHAGFVAGTTPAVQFVAGDYWLAEVREMEHKAGNELIVNEVPLGIEHHYLTLGKVVGGVLQDNPEADRKYAFPPLTEMTCMFMAGGDGQEAMPGHELPQPIEVAVANGEWLVEGVSVHFSIEEGAGELSKISPVTTIVSSVEVETDEKGIARCYWKLGDGVARRRVKAELIGRDGNPLEHPPVYFNANLSTADQVAYTPKCKPETENTTHKLLSSDTSLPALGTDGYYTVKDVLDALLCELKATHIPFDSEDCTKTNTVKSLLEINPATTVHEVLDKLLCDFNATHLPIDKDDVELCGRLKAEGIETVQDALDTLCRMERGGGGCAVTVGENGGQHPTLKEAFDALAAEDDISLCLMPGNHQVAQDLVISGKHSIKISGAGSHGSVIESLANMKFAADDIQFKDLGVDVTSFEHGISLKGDKIGADGCSFTRTDVLQDIHLWSKNYKSTGREYGQGVAVDLNGNMLVTGYFTGKVDFGGKILTATGEDLFVAKLSPEGELIWVHNYSSTGNEHGLGIAVGDVDGNVVVTGHFDGEVTFGSQTLNAEGTDLFVLKLEPKAGTVIWARNFKNSGREEGHGVAVDGDGNVLLTGYFEGVVDADGNWLIANGMDLFVIKLEPKAGNVLWAHNYVSTGNEHGMGIAVDSEGYVILTGYFDGKVAFGKFELSAKGKDLFVLKLEPKAGNVLWAHNYVSTGNEHGMGIAVDPKGYVILTGYFDGVAFGEFELRAEGTDMFVVKLEPEAGKVIWANNYPLIGVDYGMAVAADAGGNVFVTGYFNAKTIFGDFRMRASGEDMFVLKLDPEGKEIWVKQFGGAGDQRGLGIAVHPKGYVHVTGYFSGAADFGDHKLIAMGVDLFALMLEPQKGDVSWVRNFANVSDERAVAVAVDPDGNVLVTGNFTGAVDFGGQVLEANGIDLFVIKLGAGGNDIWAKNYQGTGQSSGNGIAADRQGNVFVTGSFDGEVEFGRFKLTSTGIDLFVLKLSPDGEVDWAQNYKSTGLEVGGSVAVDADGNVLVTDIFEGTVVFDDFELSATGMDLFVLKLSPNGKVVWAQNYKGTGWESGRGVAVDADGNVLVTGSFTGKVEFGEITLLAKGTDLFVLKLEPKAGSVLWAHNYEGEGDEYGSEIAVDPNGYVILTGDFYGGVVFGEFELRSEGQEMFVLKLSPDGEVVWAQDYQGTFPQTSVLASRVAVDPAGHILATGFFRGEVDFDGRHLLSKFIDVFVLKLSSEGRVVWAHNFVSTGQEHGYGIAADRQGNVLVTGQFDGTVDFGGGTLTSVGLDLFITKLAIPGAAPPLVEVRPAKDKEEVDLNWNRNTMHMSPAGDAVANPGLRLDGLFDALALSGSTIGGNIENNRISGKVVLMSDFPDSMDIDPEGTVARMVISRKMPFVAQSVLNIRSNELNNIYSRIPLGALQNGILKNHELEFFGSMMITNNIFRENDSSFFGMRMTMTGNQFIGADNHSDVAAIVLGAYGTFSDNQAHRNAMIQRVLTFKKQSSNDLNFQDLTGPIGDERLVLLNGEETPAGTTMAFSAQAIPDGWMECNGYQINRMEFAALFDAIGTRFGSGDGETTFNVPDLRGRFVRGWAHGSNNDPERLNRLATVPNGASGDNVGSYQGDAFQNHRHNFTGTYANIGGGGHSHLDYASGYQRAMSGYSWSSSNHSSLETRPKNIFMMYCIKY